MTRFLALALLAGGTLSGSAQEPRLLVRGRGGIPVLVGFNGPCDAAVFTSHGGVVESVNPKIDCVAGRIPARAIPLLRRHPRVRYVEHERIVRLNATRKPAAASVETDPLWGLRHIATEYVWPSSKGNGVKVAVIDSGIGDSFGPPPSPDPNPPHADLVGQVYATRNFVPGGESSDDIYVHGTHCAGTIAALSNGSGVVGLAYEAKVANVKIFNWMGSTTQQRINNAITWAADPAEGDADVLSMSFGGGASTNSEEDAVNYAWGQGAVLVAAAGNSASSTPHYPAAYANVIAVAASGHNGTIDFAASFTNRGAWVTISAPGVRIRSCVPLWADPDYNDGYGSDSPDDGYEEWDGTSMATPHVAACAALAWAYFRSDGFPAPLPGGLATQNAYIRARLEGMKGPPITTGAVTIPGLVLPWRATVGRPKSQLTP